MDRRSFATPPSLWTRLEEIAAERGESTSAVIRAALYQVYDADGRLRAMEASGTLETVERLIRDFIVTSVMLATMGVALLLANWA